MVVLRQTQGRQDRRGKSAHRRTRHVGPHRVTCFDSDASSRENAALASSAEHVLVAQPPRDIGNFELTDQDGRSFQFSQLHGQTVLVFFGFAHCPDVCQPILHKLKLLTSSSGHTRAPAPTVVMISVDGDRDTPAAMKAYLAPLSAGFIGLTGDPRTVRKIAARFSAVFFRLVRENCGRGFLSCSRIVSQAGIDTAYDRWRQRSAAVPR